MRNRMRPLSIAFSFVFACAAHANGQTTQGEIVGTVTDSAGLVAPGVEITATSRLTGFNRVTNTNESGGYVVSHLEPSTYVVSASLLGFKKAQSEPVVLEDIRKLRVDLRLEVGEISCNSGPFGNDDGFNPSRRPI